MSQRCFTRCLYRWCSRHPTTTTYATTYLPRYASFKWRRYSVDSNHNNTDGNKILQDTIVDGGTDVTVQTNEAQLELIKEQMKMDIKRSQELNMSVRLNKPRVDLSDKTQITVKHTRKETEFSEIFRHCLDEEPTVEGFCRATKIYKDKNKHVRRGHIDFICAGLKFLTPYNLHKNHEVYEVLMDVMPREKFRNTTWLDVVAPRPHPQIFLALDILTKMEFEGLIPRQQMHDLVLEIFGVKSAPLEKLGRMQFWLDEYYDLNPYKLNDDVFLDRVDIIRAAIERLFSINDYARQTERNVITKIIEISPPIQEEKMINYKHFIISGRTDLTVSYIDSCRTVFIEGPHFTWMNHHPEEYFVMKTGQGEVTATTENQLSHDEEREGAIIAICFATKPYRETLQKWLTHMQGENGALQHVNVVFDVSDQGHDDMIAIPSG